MSDNKFSFNLAVLKKLPSPEKGKRAYYYDNKVAGLGLAITPAGRKTFIVYRKIAGKPERITLGYFPDISINDARAQAHQINADIAQGINPNAQRRAARAEQTLGDCFQQYLDYHAKPHKRSWQQDEAQFQRYLQTWAKRKLSSIHKQDVQILHVQLGEQHGHYAANRLLALLHGVFDKAREWGWQHDNPATGIKKFPEKSRERFLQAEELPCFFAALEAESNQNLHDYVWLSLLTGARKSNVLSMRWADINFNQSTWFIAQTKNGTAQTIPLLTESIGVLEKRLAKQITGQAFVFPSRSKTGYWMEPKKAWKKLLDRAEIEDLRLHDLRRSLGSWQAATGASLSIIGKTLNHKSSAATEIYARLDLKPVRAAMELATAAMLEASKQSAKN